MENFHNSSYKLKIKSKKKLNIYKENINKIYQTPTNYLNIIT